MTGTSHDPSDPHLALWLALAILTSGLVGVGTGTLAWIAGEVVASAFLVGFGGFSAALTLALLVIGVIRNF